MLYNLMQKVGDSMGRPRKFKTVNQLEKAWTAYKADCDSRWVVTHGFSAANSEFVTECLMRGITYTVKGFCLWCGLARSTFYQSYGANERFSDIITRIKDECEVDAREKFELGMLDPRLAFLWMSRFGYGSGEKHGIVVIRGDANLSD